MKAGRVIGGDEHDARVLAQQIVDDARAEAERLREAAHAELARLRHDAEQLATRLIHDARADAERAAARAAAEAVCAREHAERPEHREQDERLVSGRGEHLQGDPSAAPVTGAPARAVTGTVDEVVGLVIRASVAGAALGEIVRIDRRGREPLSGEVVGFRGEQAVVLPLGDVAGIAPAGAVWRTGAPLEIRCGDGLLGRVLDGVGDPLDGGPPLDGERWAVDRPAPAALSRPPIAVPQPTGVRALDALLTIGRGQRVGLFAAAGVGKSTLLGQIARGASADVIVLCLVGERGRELSELLRDELAPARARTVVVCATSDAPPLVRLRAIHTATAIAEWFRERAGAAVLLLCDSLTRVARAQREVGLSVGEPPARHGYPPSVFALLPRLIERTGATPRGVITAIYTVLVAGNDLDEPIADEVRGLVDGHIVLDRRLAQRGQFPPIDVVASGSRVMARVVDRAHADAAAQIRARLAIYEEHRDLITLGAYQAGRDRAVDDAVRGYPAIEQLVRQRRDDLSAWDASISGLLTLAGPG
jgi:ATP synthase in type III secretion protein N